VEVTNAVINGLEPPKTERLLSVSLLLDLITQRNCYTLREEASKKDPRSPRCTPRLTVITAPVNRELENTIGFQTPVSLEDPVRLKPMPSAMEKKDSSTEL